MTSIWKEYQVSLNFLTKLCGSVPADPDILETWLQTRQPAVRPPNSKSIAEIQEEIVETLAQDAKSEQNQGLTIFQRHEGGLAVRTATFRSHIKDCARTVSAQYIGKIRGERSFSSRVINGVYHDEHEYWTPILDAKGKPFTQPAGILTRPITCRMRDGSTITALKSFEYVESAQLNFTLKVLGDSLSQEDLEMIFTYGGVHGYGGERGAGEGRYESTIKEKNNDRSKK